MSFRYVTTTDGDQIPFVALKSGLHVEDVLIKTSPPYIFEGYTENELLTIVDGAIEEYSAKQMETNTFKAIWDIAKMRGILQPQLRTYLPQDSKYNTPYVLPSDYDASKCLKIKNDGVLSTAIMCGYSLVADKLEPFYTGDYASWGFAFFRDFVNGVPTTAYYQGFNMTPYYKTPRTSQGYLFPDYGVLKVSDVVALDLYVTMPVMFMDDFNHAIGGYYICSTSYPDYDYLSFKSLGKVIESDIILPPTTFLNKKGAYDIMERFSPRVATNMIGLYPLDKNKVSVLFDDLWTTTLFEGWNYNLFGKPTDSILSLKWFYGIKDLLPLSKTPCYVKLGNIAFNGGAGSVVTSYPVTTEFVVVNVGTVKIPKYFNNYLDYEPYTKVQLYLPFHGFVSLNCNEVMDGWISVQYNINLVTGMCLALVFASNVSDTTPILQVPCEMSMEIPININSMQSLAARTFDTARQALQSGVSAAITYSPEAKTLTDVFANHIKVGIAQGLASVQGTPEVSRGGNSGGEMGCLSSFQTRVVVARPINLKPDNLTSIVGYAANSIESLSAQSGFTQVSSVTKPSAIDNKYLAEIVSLLQEGVYF